MAEDVGEIIPNIFFPYREQLLIDLRLGINTKKL